jgi:hypothetical protein
MSQPNALPIAPDPFYLLRLADTHLVHGALADSRAGMVAAMDAAGLPQNLRAGLDSWHMPGHLGEITQTAVALEAAVAPSPAVRTDAVKRGALFMSLLAVTDAAASEYHAGRTVAGTAAFLDNVVDAALDGPVSTEVEGGPLQQRQVYRYANVVAEHLSLDGSDGSHLEAPLAAVVESWLARMEESAPGRRNPERLLQIAQETGAHITEAGAVLLLGYRGNQALSNLGAIGGIEEASANPFRAIRNGLHTYVTALVARSGGIPGLNAAARMRGEAELAQYQAGYASLETGREKRIFRTVAWFATKAGMLDRRAESLEGRRRGEAAHALQQAVRSGDNHGNRGGNQEK